jgi:hypothetical protein
MPIKSVLYLFGQLLLAFRSRAGGIAGVGIVLAIAWVLWLALALLLNAGHVEDVSVQLLAALNRPIAQAEVSALIEQSRAWPEVRRVRYVFPEQTRNTEMQLPQAARDNGYLELQLQDRGDRDAVATRLSAQASWLSIIPPERGLARHFWQDEPTLHPIVFGALAGFFLVVLILFYCAFRLLAQSWMAEGELLKLAGLSSRALALPFSLLGLFSGLLATVGAAALASWSPFLARRIPLLSAWLPELRDSRLNVEISLAAALIGLVFSGLVGLLAFVTVARALKRLRLAGRSASGAPKLQRAKAQEGSESQRQEDELQRLER